MSIVHEVLTLCVLVYSSFCAFTVTIMTEMLTMMAVCPN